MNDPAAIARQYIEVWNETDPGRRAELLATGWTETASYVDPLAAAHGPEQISALIGGVQERFPNFRFSLVGKPDGHGDHVRFSWALGPGDYVDAPIQGTDFATIAAGKLAAVTGFLDKVPLS